MRIKIAAQLSNERMEKIRGLPNIVYILLTIVTALEEKACLDGSSVNSVCATNITLLQNILFSSCIQNAWHYSKNIHSNATCTYMHVGQGLVT